MTNSTVQIKLDNINDGYLPYSTDTNTELKEEFAKHIINQTNETNIKGPLNLVVELNSPASDEEKSHFARSLKKCFDNRLNESKKAQKHHFIIASIMLFAGLVLGLVFYFLQEHELNFLIEFFFEVSAWVFIWEAVDISCFQVPYLRFNSRNYASIAKSKIIFIETSSLQKQNEDTKDEKQNKGEINEKY